MEDALEDEPARHSLDRIFFDTKDVYSRVICSSVNVVSGDAADAVKNTTSDLESGGWSPGTNTHKSDDHSFSPENDRTHENPGRIINSTYSTDNHISEPKNKTGNLNKMIDTPNSNDKVGTLHIVSNDGESIKSEQQKERNDIVESLVDKIVDTGSLDIIDNFSDKYAIILGLTLYDYYFFNVRYPLEVLLVLAVVIVFVNVVRYLIDYHTSSIYAFSPKNVRSHRYVSFWSFIKDTCVNVSNALVVVEVKLFTLIIHRLLIDQYDKTDINLIIILFVIPFLILKSLPMIVYWFGQLSLYNNIPVNDTDKQTRQQKLNTNAHLIVPYIGDFFGNFSEKYSLLLALDLYDYVALSGERLLVEYFGAMFVLLCVLCILRSSILILTLESHIRQKLFCEFLENIVKYAIQLLVILEIKYFGTKICGYAQNIAEGSPGNYHLLLLFWLPIVAIKSTITVSNWIRRTQDIVVTSIDGINDLLDAFLDKYILLISFDIYHVIKHQKRLDTLELLCIVLIMNIFSYVLQSCFLFLQSKRHFNSVILWKFWVDLFTYYTHVTALICLKLFAVMSQSALNGSLWNITIVLLLAPFLMIRLVPILLQTIHVSSK